MKIAAVTDDGKTISAHFGRATKYAVIIIENGRIVASENRAKVGHRDFQGEATHAHDHHHHGEHGRGQGQHSAEKHRQMFAALNDCEIVLARGMGQGAYDGLQQLGIRPVLTDISDIETAVLAVVDGSIVNQLERLH